MNRTRSLGIGPVGAFMPGEDVMEPAPLVSREMLQAFGPSLLSRMREADTAQQQRWQAGERSPTPMTEDRAWLADDVAGSLLGPMGIMGAIKAYHGSPHRFDRFDMSKIGTGEGAQAYGHGLYFAENADTAKAYQENIRHFSRTEFDGSRVAPDSVEGDIALYAARADPDNPNFADAIRSIRLKYNKALHDRGTPPELKERLAGALERLQSGDISADKFRLPERDSGALYTTRLDVEPEDLLDWDAPLSQQSEKVRAALGKLGVGSNARWEEQAGALYREGPRGSEGSVRQIDRGNGPEWLAEYDTLDGRGTERFKTLDEAKSWIETKAPIEGGRGAEIYQTLRKQMSDAEVTKMLREAGIPGIRYLDQGSRASGEGTRNFVIFDDKLIDIEGVE